MNGSTTCGVSRAVPDMIAAQLVPGDKWELVLTTRESPPATDLVEALWDSGLAEMLIRKDSPVFRIEGTGWHFSPPLDRATQDPFDYLDWNRALSVHEWAM